MPYTRRYRKKKQAPKKKAVAVRYPKHIYGAHKSWTYTEPNGIMYTGTAARLSVVRLSNIQPGTLYNERTTNAVWLNNTNLLINCRNPKTTSRYLRVMAVTLTNGHDVPDISSFTDLMTTGNFAAVVGPTGLAEDTVYNVNRNLYKLLWQKTVKIPGTSNGESNSKNYKFNVPLRRFVSYDANSSTARNGSTFLIWFLTEAEGIVSDTGNGMSLTYRVTTHFKDVLK